MEGDGEMSIYKLHEHFRPFQGTADLHAFNYHIFTHAIICRVLLLDPPLWQDPVYGNKKATGCVLRERAEHAKKEAEDAPHSEGRAYIDMFSWGPQCYVA